MRFLETTRTDNVGVGRAISSERVRATLRIVIVIRLTASVCGCATAASRSIGWPRRKRTNEVSLLIDVNEIIFYFFYNFFFFIIIIFLDRFNRQNTGLMLKLWLNFELTRGHRTSEKYVSGSTALRPLKYFLASQINTRKQRMSEVRGKKVKHFILFVSIYIMKRLSCTLGVLYHLIFSD